MKVDEHSGMMWFPNKRVRAAGGCCCWAALLARVRPLVEQPEAAMFLLYAPRVLCAPRFGRTRTGLCTGALPGAVVDSLTNRRL